jgi:hypothetical protein
MNSLLEIPGGEWPAKKRTDPHDCALIAPLPEMKKAGSIHASGSGKLG